MDASPSHRADRWFRTCTEEGRCSEFALMIRGLTKEWRGDLGDCLAKLPPELFSMVLDQLTYTTGSPIYEDIARDERKDIKSGLARTSLVCHAWCRIQRPKLFESIWLRNTGDMRFLLDMLRRPNNGWLPAVVTHLAVFHSGNRSIGISMERCCRLLLPKLTSLAVFDLDGGERPFTEQIYGYKAPSRQHFGPSLQPVFARHKNIRRLTLNSILFNSLSALVHVLVDMVNLEVFEVNYWPEHIDSSDRPPTRMLLSSFPKLRRVWHGDSSHQSGKLGWLLLPRLARQCKDHPEDAAPDNSDAALLVLLGDFLGDSSCSFKTTAITYIEGTDTILLYNWSVYSITAAKLALLWPSSSISSGKWSAIRSIECFTASEKSRGAVYHNNENLDEINWERIDLSLAQDAIRLEKLIVHSNNVAHQQRLPLRLPELCALGKFQVEETDSDYNELWREYGYPE